jgi:hypothetical protein
MGRGGGGEKRASAEGVKGGGGAIRGARVSSPASLALRGERGVCKIRKRLPGAPPPSSFQFSSRCVKNIETGRKRVLRWGCRLFPAPPAGQTRAGPACSLIEDDLAPLSNPPVGAAGRRPERKAPGGPALGEPRMRPALRARRGTGKIETGMRGARSARPTSPATPFTLPIECAVFTHGALRVIGGVGKLRGARRECQA